MSLLVPGWPVYPVAASVVSGGGRANRQQGSAWDLSRRGLRAQSETTGMLYAVY